MTWMRYYVSKSHNRLNGMPFRPELITNDLCLNPRYSAAVCRKANILLDSGAFQDVRDNQRLSFQNALQRQLVFENQQNFISECIVSYDRIVDEKLEKNIGQIKERVDFKTAEKYVAETINAAKYLADNRNELKPRKLILSCQGVEINQYLNCIEEILSFSEKGDIIGFGGFCIIGQKPKYENDYFEILKKSIPLIKLKNIKRIHLFGVGVFKTLVKTEIICQKYHIQPSYDTSSYEFNGVHGKVFNPDKMVLTKIFEKEDKYKFYSPNELAHLNIRLITNFWRELNKMSKRRIG